MDFKFGVTLLRYEYAGASKYDLRVERVHEGAGIDTKRIDYVFIPLTHQAVRFLEGIEIPTEVIHYKESAENE